MAKCFQKTLEVEHLMYKITIQIFFFPQVMNIINSGNFSLPLVEPLTRF